MASSDHAEERLEDVFQDEIIKAFANISSFKKFARSKHGLCLDQFELKTIVEDHRNNVEEHKMEMLFKWQEINGDKATVQEVRDLSRKYFRKDNSSVSNEDISLSGPSQPQALPEPTIQAALPWADGKERDEEDAHATKREMTEMNEEMKKEMTEMKKEMTEMKKEMTEMKKEMTNMSIVKNTEVHETKRERTEMKEEIKDMTKSIVRIQTESENMKDEKRYRASKKETEKMRNQVLERQLELMQKLRK